jgi:hypothetical protein
VICTRWPQTQHLLVLVWINLTRAVSNISCKGGAIGAVGLGIRNVTWRYVLPAHLLSALPALFPAVRVGYMGRDPQICASNCPPFIRSPRTLTARKQPWSEADWACRRRLIWTEDVGCGRGRVFTPVWSVYIYTHPPIVGGDRPFRLPFLLSLPSRQITSLPSLTQLGPVTIPHQQQWLPTRLPDSTPTSPTMSSRPLAPRPTTEAVRFSAASSDISTTLLAKSSSPRTSGWRVCTLSTPLVKSVPPRETRARESLMSSD